MKRGKTQGEIIKFARIEKGYTQEQLASKINVNRSYISMIERGTKAISLGLAQEICNTLEINIQDLVS